jgi:RNA polymerase sigma-70 factor (ECF subfamily)
MGAHHPREAQLMDRAAEFERWLQRAVADQVGFGCAIHYTRNRHLAEELTQEAYKRAWEHRDEIESEAHLRNWLGLVIKRQAKDRGRRHKRNPVQSLVEPEAIPDKRMPLLSPEDREFVRHYLVRLSPDAHRLIELRYFEDLTLEEIHALYPEWGSVATLWKRIKAVCIQLRELMSPDEPDEP